MKKLLYMLTTTVKSSIFSVTCKDREKAIHYVTQETRETSEKWVTAVAILTYKLMNPVKQYIINLIERQHFVPTSEIQCTFYLLKISADPQKVSVNNTV